LVEKKSHHLLGKVSCVNIEGKIVSVNREEYQSNEYLVNIMSKEGFKRLGKCESERFVFDVSNVDFSNKKNSLKGENRTQKQKSAALKHSKWAKENAKTPTKKGSKLSEAHRQALSFPKPWAGKHKNHPKGNEHFAKVIVKCPYCGKEGGGGSMKRWHFDNCKLKND
jgi:hypothetical protein